MAVLVADVFLGVWSRYVMHATFQWYDEVARLCFVWMIFLGAAVAVRRGAHFRLHLLVDRCGPATRRWVDLLGTLVVITSDHGESLGEHGERTHGLFAYESTLRVPLIVAEILPRTFVDPHGEVSHVAARHIDILPTILEAVGQAVPADLPGRSLLTAAERRDQAADRTSYFEAMGGMLNRGWAPLTGIIHGGAKYIDLPIAELYDLPRDPHEMKNLRDGFDQERLGEAGRASDEAMSAGEQRDEELFDDLLLADDDLGQFRLDLGAV